MEPENVALLTLPAKARTVKSVLEKARSRAAKPHRKEITLAITCFESILIELENLRAARAKDYDDA